MSSPENDVINRQLVRYRFPYHWIPEIRNQGVVAGRSLSWALEYVGYMSAVSEIVEEMSPISLIDIGCGDGRFAEFITSKIACEYYGIDISHNAVEFAKCFSPNRTFECVDLAKVTKQFDMAVAIEVLEHIPDEQLSEFLFNSNRVLKSDGIFVISVPTSIRPVHKKHFRHYDEKMLEVQLGPAGFQIIRMNRVHKIGLLSEVLRIVSSNRVYTLNESILTKCISFLYKRYCHSAAIDNGAHLIAIARKV